MGAFVRRTLIVALTLLAAAPAAAAAATRYAGPSGSGTSCSDASPCSVTTAIEDASVGDDIIVLPGNYDLTSGIVGGADDLTVQGESGQPVPTITLTDPGDLLSVDDTNLSDLDLAVDDGTAVDDDAATLTDLEIEGVSETDNSLCQCYDGVISDSLIVATGDGAAGGVSTNGGTFDEKYYNDTLIATSASAAAIGLYEQDTSPSPNEPDTLETYNTIAINTAGGNDVVVAGNSGDTSEALTVTMTHSDYRDPSTSGPHTSIANGGGNISGAPLFVSGGYQEEPTSPTIAAGVTNAAVDASTDLAGNPRSVDGLTDIGAYEYKAISASARASSPSVTTAAAATFTATASDPNAGASPLTYSWRFDDGATATGATVSHAFATPGKHTATVTVSDGTPYIATASATVTVTQVLASVSDTALTLQQPRKAHGKHKAKPLSATLSLTLNTSATIAATVDRRLKGKRVHGRCESARTARAHHAPCPTTKFVGSFSFSVVQGANTQTLPLSKHLPPGHYTLTLTASDAGGSSTPVTLDFTVK